MATREQNERKFQQWLATPGGGRRYWLEIAGRHGWRARYFKLVDSAESTLRFWQEIYDETGKLIEIQEQCPADTGHRRIEP